MMFVLYDDRGLETFDSPNNPPSDIEAIDVENEEYDFCDDRGQRYVGKIIKQKGFFSADKYELIPDGLPDPVILENLLNRAVYLDGSKEFANLEDLKKHLAS